MRFRMSMSAAACVFAAGLGAAGCSSVGSIISSNGPASTSPANTRATGQAGAGTTARASSQQPPGAAGARRCQPGNLSFTLGAKVTATATAQAAQVVDLTNEGSSACTMEGYPGVNLVGVADGRENYTWPLARASAGYARESHMPISRVTLRPGATAHFEIRYLPGTPGHGSRLINVVKMVITPPNDYTQGQLTWGQDIVLQDAATHPGTYLMPVVPGS